MPIARRRAIEGMSAWNLKGKIEMSTLTNKCWKGVGSLMMNEEAQRLHWKSPDLLLFPHGIHGYRWLWGINQPIDFLVDTGATYSVLNTKLNKKSSGAVTVTGVTGVTKTGIPATSEMTDQKLMHSFLCMPDHPIPLLGWDLLCKLFA